MSAEVIPFKPHERAFDAWKAAVERGDPQREIDLLWARFMSAFVDPAHRDASMMLALTMGRNL